MGNKILRPNELQPLSGFNDDQISYLKDKFEILCDESKLLSITKISDAFKCSRQQAAKILNYIDFENQGQVDFYQFTCAAATLHQSDEEALQFLYDLFGNNQELDQNCFQMIYGTVFRYLKFLDKITEEYDHEVAAKKFKQYDYNNNQKIGFDQFKSMLTNDYHCRMWMQTLGFVEERPQEFVEKPQNQQIAEGDDFIMEEAKGDQAGSTPSWIKTVQYMAPQNYSLPENLDTPPTSNLDIQYVYGYRCYDARDNLKYNANGEAVYHTAGVGIVLNKLKNTMRVTTAHNNDITCLDLNLNKNLVATGQMGRRPSIVVWDPNTLAVKNVFKSKLQKSVGNIAISKNGRFLAATSMSDNHQIAIYDLNKNALVSFGPGPKSVIYAIKFTSNQEELVCACQKQVVFAKFLSGRVQTKRGIFGKAPMTANFCIGLVGDAIVTGMANGAIGYWKGNMCSRVYKQHVKPITALCQKQDGGIISGDSTGCIIIWTPNLSKQREIQLSKLVPNSNNPRIISLCEGFGNILIGTRGGEIIEVQQKNTTANILMEGHFDQQLWGLSVVSNRHQFITGGQDKLLIKWDADKRKIITKKKMDYSISSIDISRNGELAVGHTNGIIHIYDSDKIKFIRKIQTFKNPDKQVISVVKFSPNGSTLAVGYCPPVSEVFLYNVENGSKIGQCKGSPSRIISIDYSRDGSSIMINNTSYEILFYNTSNAAQIKQATTFRNQQFATMTSRFSWHTKGIWPPCSDGTDINSLDRSNNKKYLVTADDFSLVKLFKYPVAKNRQIYNQYKGHSSHVTGVKWMYDDKFVISIGGLEKSIIQWTFEDAAQIVYDYEEQKQEEQKIVDENEQYEFNQDKEQQAKQQQGQFKLEADEGDQALAVKPFLGQVQRSTPTSFKHLKMKDNNQYPERDLQIKHVWGIRNQYLADRVRNQLRYTNDFNSCIFITAALGVEMDLKTKQQKFYKGQTEDLISFAITKDRKFCATGQMAQLNSDNKRARQKIVDVYIWDTQTKQKKAKLGGFHQRAIVVLEFSPSGKKLLTVGQDDKNSLAVYNWQANRIAFKSPVCGAKVTGGAWRNQGQFMTVGLKHVKLWMNNKGMMCKVPGKWDPMVSVVCWNDKYVSGGIQGTLYLWSGTTSISTKAHEGSVDCLSVDQNGTLFSGCSKGVINKWKYSGGKLVLDQKVLNMEEIDKFSPGVLSLDFSPDNYLICTNSSSIYEVPKNSKQNVNVVMQSHYEVQLWGQSWSKDHTRFVTGGDDKTVRIYDTSTFQMLHSYKMSDRVRGVDWEKSKGELIAVGDYKGRVHLFNDKLQKLSSFNTKFSRTKPRQQPYWIQAIRFSPNGEYLAFGAHGGATYISLIQIKGNQFGEEKISQTLISSAALSIDWSQDSTNLAVVSQAYQLQFTNMTQKANASAMRDVKWATWSGKFGAYVKQIHQDVDYSNINAVDMSPTGSLIATGGDDQKVRLFKSPVIIPKQKNKAFDGHSSHVTNVRFSNNQRYLLSTGGNDRTIILWKLSGDEEEEQVELEKDVQQGEQKIDQGNEGNEDADFIDIPKIKQEDQQNVDVSPEDDGEFQLQTDEGDQFGAVKPWMGAIKQPSSSSYYRGSGKAPNVELQLQYAHGYRSKDCRNNLIYLSQNKIAYHTAGLGVIMDTSTDPRQQTFFNLHTDDIISMCWDNEKNNIFTGQMGAKPIIYQWNQRGEMIHRYRGVTKGVSALGMNQKYLAAAGMDDNHYVYLFDIKTEKLICSQKGGPSFITALKWINEQTFVTIGIKHFKIWTVSEKSIKGKTGLFNNKCNILVSLAIKEPNIFAGASDGSLQVWSSNSCTTSKKVHSKSLNAIAIKGDVILTGSSDESICILETSSLNELARIDCKSILINSVCRQIQALDIHENKIIVGTKGSEIYQIKSNKAIADTDESSKFNLLGHYMSGHYSPNFVTNQVWGLAVYDNIYYLTSSDDGTLRVWDINKKQQVMVCNLDITEKLTKRQKKSDQKWLPKSCKGNTICVAKTGEVVVGCKDGRIIVFDNKFRPKLVQTVTQKQISIVKLSPDQSVLGVGDHDGRIHLLQWSGSSKKMKLRTNKIKHPSTVKHFDFSRDSNVIHSTCSSYNLLFWNVQTGQLIGSGATSYRDEEWATWTIPFGWPVQGIFEVEMDGTDINAIDRSKRTFGKDGMRLLASADDRGQVRLLEYPCITKNSSSVVGKGHSSHVTNVQFSQDDSILFSTGGEDQTVMQWKVKGT